MKNKREEGAETNMIVISPNNEGGMGTDTKSKRYLSLTGQAP